MECDTFNGNVVLVPAPIVAELGHVDGAHFPHAMGDIDYGLRVRSSGFGVVQVQGTVGMCERNPLNPPEEARYRAYVRWLAKKDYRRGRGGYFVCVTVEGSHCRTLRSPISGASGAGGDQR
jgi:GT2 family glycosyltransferase